MSLIQVYRGNIIFNIPTLSQIQFVFCEHELVSTALGLCEQGAALSVCKNPIPGGFQRRKYVISYSSKAIHERGNGAKLYSRKKFFIELLFFFLIGLC